MRYALSVPCFGDWGDPASHVALARVAEEAGWDGYFIWDHIRVGEWAGPVVDPWVTLAAVAVATARIRIGTMVTPLPRRRPAKLARETVTLDHLSGGRLVLGVGIGTPRDVEFGDLGDSADDRVRARQLDEGLELLVRMWSGETVDHAGEHYLVRSAHFLPRPVQQPRIPIWVAATWPHLRPLERAARWDGVVPITYVDGDHRPCTAEELEEVVAYVRAKREGEAPFDIVAGGSTYRDPAAGAMVAERKALGVTWWLEAVGWPPDGVAAWTEHVAAGPPH